MWRLHEIIVSCLIGRLCPGFDTFADRCGKSGMRFDQWPGWMDGWSGRAGTGGTRRLGGRQPIAEERLRIEGGRV
jgi:hypothetical protein